MALVSCASSLERTRKIQWCVVSTNKTDITRLLFIAWPRSMTFNVFLRVQEVEVSFSGLFRVPCVFKGMFRV